MTQKHFEIYSKACMYVLLGLSPLELILNLIKSYLGWGILLSYRIGEHTVDPVSSLFAVQLPPNMA